MPNGYTGDTNEVNAKIVGQNLGGSDSDQFNSDELIAVIKQASDGHQSEANIRRVIAKRDMIRSFGSLIRDCRRTKRLTQVQLALLANVSKSTIANIESGMLEEGPRLGTLADLLFITNHELRPVVERRRFLYAVEDSCPSERPEGDASVSGEHSPSSTCSLLFDVNNHSDSCKFSGNKNVKNRSIAGVRQKHRKNQKSLG